MGVVYQYMGLVPDCVSFGYFAASGVHSVLKNTQNFKESESIVSQHKEISFFCKAWKKFLPVFNRSLFDRFYFDNICPSAFQGQTFRGILDVLGKLKQL